MRFAALILAWFICGEVRGDEIDKAFAAQKKPTQVRTEVDARIKGQTDEARERVVERTQEIERQKREEARSARSSTANGATGGGSPFTCSYICRGSLYATGGRYTIVAFGADADSAREAAKDRAAKVCNTEAKGKSGAWWPDMALCKPQ